MRTKASLIFAAICGALLLTTASAANAAEAPYGGTAAAVPGTVQAENYDTGGAAVAYNVTSTNGSDNGYRSDGVDLEVTTDTGGGVDLGWSAAGQWFKYTVNVATAGKYTVTFRVAAESAIADGLHISNSAGTNLSGSVAVPNTGGWQTWTSVTASVTLPAGTQTLTINQDAAGWNMNWLSFAAVSSGEGPYGGTAAAIPGTVMASNYDTGGQGVGYSVSSTNGSANTYRSDGVDLEAATSPATGDDLGWTAAGQWFRYTVNVSTAGTYTVSILVASPTAVADGFHISNSSGTNLSGSVAVPATGGYQTWVTVTATVTLPAGTQTLTVNQDAGGWNIDSLKFASSGGGGGGEGPYPSTAAAIPGTVMAENYDTGGQGVAYNVTSTNGTANTYRTGGVDLEAATAPATGNDLGWSAAGQWFRYTVNVSTAGTYTASFLVASPTAVGDGFHISNSSGTNLTGSVAVPATGGYQTWVTVTANITLPAGTQTLTLNEDAAGWNIDSMAFASGGGGLTSAKITAGTYTFIPQNATGLRLDDEAASTATGNPIDVYTANSTAAQNWALTSSGVTPAGYYNLSTEGAYCLTASGTASGSAVVLDPCAGSSGQAWAAVASGSNYTFHPANNTALCLDVAAAGTASGTLVQVYTCNATSAQSWALSTAGSGGGGGGTPGKTFAPFEYVGDLGDANQIPGIVSASGAKAVILAFVDPDNGGCNLIWPGASGPIPTDTVGSTSMGTAISQMQAAGVTVAISQGGAGGQEAAAYCSSASATQAVYQQLITKYNVKWLDFDVEYGETSGQSVRRAQALAALQAAYPGLIVSYTLPLGPGGLNGGGGGGTQDIIDAKNAGLNLTIVNGMAMDFGGTNTNQASLSEQGAASLESQIQSAGLSSTVGLTFLPGTSDDSPPNYFTLANASTMVSFANSNSYISLLSFWELNRDNGGCPGSTSDQDTCSGVSQSNYEFSSIFEAF